MNDISEWMARYEEEQRLRKTLEPDATDHNKAVLFELLASAGIAKIIVDFDGYGDSGQIERVALLKADNVECLPPEGNVALHIVRHDGSGVDCVEMTVPEAIERLAYDFLGQEHSGWENNDGAYGDFTFDVAERTITLEYNERFTSSEQYSHTW